MESFWCVDWWIFLIWSFPELEFMWFCRWGVVMIAFILLIARGSWSLIAHRHRRIGEFVIVKSEINLKDFWRRWFLTIYVSTILLREDSFLKGRSIPGKVLLTRRSDHLEGPNWQDLSPKRGLSENETGPSSRMDKSVEVIFHVRMRCC